MELVRLAIPRRVYTQSHIDYVSEVIIKVFSKKNEIKGMQIIEEAETLRHFTVKMKEISDEAPSSMCLCPMFNQPVKQFV